jgi:3-hydroxyisobutyrate dehydrogenase-like beta-hydroxyacid dehydrogenase
MATDAPHIGVVGLGKMGAGIARNIQKAGFAMTVYNRTASKTQPFVRGGATAVTSPREAAERADVVVTCLMGDASVLGVLEGDEGILAGLRPGKIHVGTSTISPACATEVAGLHAAHGSTYVAAPVLGRPDVAEAGELRTFVSGDADAIARCTALFEAYTQMILNVGTEPHIASTVKICVNYMAMSVIELMGQVYTFGEKSGVEPSHLALIMKTMFPQPQLQEYAERIQGRHFHPAGFAVSGGLKDVDLFLKAAGDVQAALPYASVVRDKLLTAVSRGMEEHDWSAIYEISRLQAGLE